MPQDSQGVVKSTTSQLNKLRKPQMLFLVCSPSTNVMVQYFLILELHIRSFPNNLLKNII